MADNVTELSTTASNNSAYDGISILGTAAVSNFDDALRAFGAMIRSGMDTGNIMGSAYLTKSAGYTALTTDRGKTINCTASLTLALTAAATLESGWICIVKANGGDVTIDPNGSETINGSATYTVNDGGSVIVVCDGTNFQIVPLMPPPATKADQETATSTEKMVTPAHQQSHPSSPKAWAAITNNGSVTLDAAYNISGVVRNGTGDVTISWDTNFSSANYVAVCTPENASYSISVTSKAVGSINVLSRNGANAATDTNINIVAFGDQ